MVRPRLTQLSAAQRRILEALAKLERAGEPGFVSTLVEALGLKAESSLSETLRRMERNGFLRLGGGGARGRQRLVQLSPKGRLQLPSEGRPAVLPLLGFIPAGPLQEAVQEHGEALAVEELLPHRQGDFLLRVRGDSMTGDGILDGDIVLLRPRVQLQPGEIAAVLVGCDQEATLKHVHFEDGGRTVLLRASNPAYADVRLPAESGRIAGVFRGLVRS
jgi:repressor LexA